ncbi:MAG TPA: peptidylprolyl isomerase [Gemmatimonadaceae bacterium]|nr:peptidylprolyl isomerase [Gemmatimonadaceae bacterium]
MRATLEALVAAAALTVACTGGAPEVPAPAKSVDAARTARILQMADDRRLDTGLISDALRHGSSAEREIAARAIGQVNGAPMAPTLRSLLLDRDTAVAANAAFSLGLMRDSASVGALAPRLRGPPTVGVEAAWALGRIGEPARGAIEQALRADTLATPVAGALLLAAARLKPPPVDLLSPYLANDSPSVRWRAAYIIARPYASNGVRLLLPLYRDTSSEVRVQVARAFSHHAAGDSLAATVRPLLDTLVHDPDPHVRVNAARSLASYGPANRAAVMDALHDSDPNVRIATAQVLGPVLETNRGQWMAAWTADTGLMYRSSVMEQALSQDVVPPAAETDDPDGWRHQSDWRQRAAVANAGASAPIMRMREISLPLTRDPDARVRAVAYAAMAPHADTADKHPWRREFMYFPLHDPDYVVRQVAIASLIGHANAAEAPRIVDAYHRSEGDSLPDARVAAVGYLTAAWRRDSANFSDTLRAAVRALPVPPDERTRAAADTLPLLAAWRTAPKPPGVPLATFDSVVRQELSPALGGTLPRADIVTERGTITLELFALDAPLTVRNFIDLARSHYFDGARFHRVVPNFVAQDGDRRGDGNGGQVETIRDELNRRRYERGAVGMALDGADTGGSQYFLTLTPQPHLDGGYTVFARVVAGLDVMDALVQGDLISMITVH